MDLLGELGALMDGSRLLLSSALGRVESFPMSLSVLLDVLVLGHLVLLPWRGGGRLSALRGSRRGGCRLHSSPVPTSSRRALVTILLMHAYATAVETSYCVVERVRGQASCVLAGLTCFAASKLASGIAEALGNLERVLAPLGHGSGARHVY